MEKARDVRSKAEAIRSFLDHHQPKLSEARGFLQFLLAREEILRRLEIVEDLTGCTNAILVSAKGTGSWPFFYRRAGRFFNRTSQAVVELMKHVPEPLYLCLSTDARPWDPEHEEFMAMLARWREEAFDDEIDRLRRKFDLLHQIDQALERGDQTSFMELTGELRQLEA